jgi:hypothetical protein
MTLSADLQNLQISDNEIADNPERHVVATRPAVTTDVMKRSLARLDRVRYRPRDRERGEERAGAEKLSLSDALQSDRDTRAENDQHEKACCQGNALAVMMIEILTVVARRVLVTEPAISWPRRSTRVVGQHRARSAYQLKRPSATSPCRAGYRSCRRGQRIYYRMLGQRKGVEMKKVLELVLCILHPIAVVLIWINLALRSDLGLIAKLTWAIASIVPFVPFVYVLTGNDFI